MPHLKRGAIRDFKNIMQQHYYWVDSRWNATDFVYTFETGSILEFFSSDNADKLRGARRDRLFINECNNVSFDAFEQLEVRTKDFVFLDWNPTNEFWFYEEVLGKRNDVEMIILTYKDNEALDPRIVASIEQRKARKGWWQVYGLGQLGEVEGKIYIDWQIIDQAPHEARLVARGLDFGYSNDPSALIAIYKFNDGYIWDEEIFRTGMTNQQIGNIILNLPYPETLIVGDSAEPKSIAELRLMGINILPAIKGKGSINTGIDFVKNQKISITKRSVNTIKEYRNYLWMVDKDGRVLNIPEEGFNHGMDAGRYAMNSLFVPDNFISEARVTYHNEE